MDRSSPGVIKHTIRLSGDLNYGWIQLDIIAGVHEDTASIQKNGLFEFDSPLEFRPMVAKLLINNDLFAAKNSDLTFTDTVKFHTDTSDAPSIKLRR